MRKADFLGHDLNNTSSENDLVALIMIVDIVGDIRVGFSKH